MRDTCTSIADKVILVKEISKSVKYFQRSTNVSDLWPFFSMRKNRGTVPHNIIDIIKMIEARVWDVTYILRMQLHAHVFQSFLWYLWYCVVLYNGFFSYWRRVINLKCLCFWKHLTLLTSYAPPKSLFTLQATSSTSFHYKLPYTYNVHHHTIRL